MTPEWHDIIPVASLPIGERFSTVINAHAILIINLEGEIYAIEDCCTHQALPLTDGEIEGSEITCPFHGAKFNIITGEVTEPPAFEDLMTFQVRILEGMIQVYV